MRPIELAWLPRCFYSDSLDYQSTIGYVASHTHILISLPSYHEIVTGSSKLDLPVCKLFRIVLKLALPCLLHYRGLTLTENYNTNGLPQRMHAMATSLQFLKLNLPGQSVFAWPKIYIFFLAQICRWYSSDVQNCGMSAGELSALNVSN